MVDEAMSRICTMADILNVSGVNIVALYIYNHFPAASGQDSASAVCFKGSMLQSGIKIVSMSQRHQTCAGHGTLNSLGLGVPTLPGP